jgi:Ni,Fe-hydrogenase III small subunit/ferredoxin
MLTWPLRGLGAGTVTTKYPRRAEPVTAGFQGQVVVLHGDDASPSLETICPTSALRVMADHRVELDCGRCVLCGNCVRSEPERFGFSQAYESASNRREGLVDQQDPDGTGGLGPRRTALGNVARSLRKSIHVRHIDTGSDGSEEWEVQALWNPYYDIQRLGFFLTSSPRHADILLVTGPVTEPMRAPLELTWELMPEPKALVAVGTDACSGGFSAELGTTAGGVDKVLPVDVYIPGSPPSPFALIDGLLLAVGLLRAGDAR